MLTEAIRSAIMVNSCHTTILRDCRFSVTGADGHTVATPRLNSGISTSSCVKQCRSNSTRPSSFAPARALQSRSSVYKL